VTLEIHRNKNSLHNRRIDRHLPAGMDFTPDLGKGKAVVARGAPHLSRTTCDVCASTAEETKGESRHENNSTSFASCCLIVCFDQWKTSASADHCFKVRNHEAQRDSKWQGCLVVSSEPVWTFGILLVKNPIRIGYIWLYKPMRSYLLQEKYLQSPWAHSLLGWEFLHRDEHHNLHPKIHKEH
jgi:hypothetical protein